MLQRLQNGLEAQRPGLKIHRTGQAKFIPSSKLHIQMFGHKAHLNLNKSLIICAVSHDIRYYSTYEIGVAW